VLPVFAGIPEQGFNGDGVVEVVEGFVQFPGSVGHGSREQVLTVISQAVACAGDDPVEGDIAVIASVYDIYIKVA
jgi:hypothetical protein